MATDRSRLTAETLNKLREDTGMDWKETSYKNDLCDSVSVDLPGISIQVWVPNAEQTNIEEEETASYSIQVSNASNAETLYDDLVAGNYSMVLFVVKAVLLQFGIRARSIDTKSTQAINIEVTKRIETLAALADAGKIAQLSVCDLAPMYGWSVAEYINRDFIRAALEKRGYTTETSTSHGVITIRVFRGLEKKG